MKYFKLVFYIVVIAVLVVAVIGLYFFADSSNPKSLGIFVNIGLIASYILTVGSILIALAFAVINLTHNKRSAIRVLIGVSGLVVILGICYALSSGEILPSYEVAGMKSPVVSKLVSASLITMYMMFIVTFIVTVYAEVRRLIK